MSSAETVLPVDHHHRDIQGGTARAAVFGISDGLVSNVSLILGVAGAGTGQGGVRLAGLAGLVSGAVSMAAGEYVSMKAQTELLERELDKERREIAERPEGERRELAAIYRSRGVDEQSADQLAAAMMTDPDLALETHAREELGIDPTSLGSARGAAVASFFAFGFGAVLPLVPWFFTSGSKGKLVSVLIGMIAALAVGVALAQFTGRSPARSAARQLLIACVAAGVTFFVGSLVGVGSV